MTEKEAIFIRTSRRSYVDFPIPAEKVTLLSERADALNAESGLSIRFVRSGAAAFNGMLKSYGMFRGVRSFFAMCGDPKDPDLYEKIGYYGEALVLYATQLGLGTCWVGGSYSKRNAKRLIDVQPGHRLIIAIAVGIAEEAPDRREAFIYRLTHRKSRSVEELYEADGEIPEWFRFGMHAVARAPSALNAQPVRFLYSGGRVTVNRGQLKGMQLIDLGIARLHFEIGSGRDVEG